jgi:hypothetical protein
MIINEVHIIDWYDGVITSIIKIDEKYYLSNCIYYNKTDNERMYYNINISKYSFLKIKKQLFLLDTFSDLEWDYINKVFKKHNEIDKLLVFKTLNLVEVNQKVFKCDQNELKKIFFPFDVGLLY